MPAVQFHHGDSGHAAEPSVTVAHPATWSQAPGLTSVPASTPPEAKVTRRAATMGILTALLVTIGSFFLNETWWEKRRIKTRPRRQKNVGTVTSRNTWTDDSMNWAFPTFSLGILTFGAVLGASFLAGGVHRFNRWRSGVAASLGILATVCLAIASVIAFRYWQPLLAEQAAGFTVRTTYRHAFSEGLASIAWGLPIVTVVGAAGALSCLVFVVSLLNDRADKPRTE